MVETALLHSLKITTLASLQLKKTTFAIVTLTSLLVASNAFSAGRTLDAAVSSTYLSASHKAASQLSTQALAVLQAVVAQTATKASILAAAEGAAPGAIAFEKVGYNWVGQLGLKFSEQGTLVQVVAREQDAR